MKKINNFKAKYVFLKPNTEEEKEKQSKGISEAYNILFNSVLKRKIEE
jgi:hypothetical protein